MCAQYAGGGNTVGQSTAGGKEKSLSNRNGGSGVGIYRQRKKTNQKKPSFEKSAVTTSMKRWFDVRGGISDENKQRELRS